MTKEIISVPQHVAIIMDGNGRWATKRLMPRVYGHRKGVSTIKEIAIRANELGIKVLTLYAFSTENWSRPEDEVNFLMKLPHDFFSEFLPELLTNNVKVEVIGDIDGLPKETHSVLNQALNDTTHCTGMVLNFAINYGSRQEISQAVQNIAKDLIDDKIDLAEIDDTMVDKYLSTSHFGRYRNPDLIIRTSGEQRLSNFLLWQAAYSEFYFTDVLWPDFNPKEFDQAIKEYNQRHRRFGSVTINHSDRR